MTSALSYGDSEISSRDLTHLMKNKTEEFVK